MLTLDLPTPAVSVTATSPLRLAAAADAMRAFLVVHFPAALAQSLAQPDAESVATGECLAELEATFVSELRELGGMSVVA